jgi:hypothetical protein
MKSVKKSIWFLMLLILFCSQAVLAARNGKVIVDQAKVFEFPRPDAPLIGTVVKEFPVQVSNFQTNGFFKVRIPGGKIGWISGSDVFVHTPEPTPEQLQAEAQPKPEQPVSPLVKVQDRIRLQLSAGIHHVSFSGLPSQISASDANGAFGGSLEAQYALSPSLYAAGRIGYISTSGAAVKLSSVPVQVGVSWVPLSWKSFRFGAGVYGGLGLLTTLTLQKNSNVSQYSATGLMGTGNLQVSYSISKKLSILFDADYRMHSLNAPASTDPAGLQLPEFTAQLGGLAGRLGVEIRI